MSDQVFGLYQIAEKSWTFAHQVYMWFVDFEKAYDRIPRKNGQVASFSVSIWFGILTSVKALMCSRCFFRLRSHSCDGMAVYCECLQKGRRNNYFLPSRPEECPACFSLSLMKRDGQDENADYVLRSKRARGASTLDDQVGLLDSAPNY
ncbi:unnamed protein product [Soboliphyme baturini]|uniref:Reverse transcriptase domain-containing protein n=1 Tax=Soboliphyme baturini TaxID=241478 RepID=A0A183J3A6_9BILA|nr:unnamed protein product [Soboliphyme baturini]